MGNVYAVGDDGDTVPLERIRCKEEYSELHLLLEKNPNLLAGEQINPDDPRKWLLITSEMPVPDPSTGEDRWSIDLFLADQDATPTFVECKRFADTRTRREVVAQMLDYAANGHFYWTKEQIRDYAEQTCSKAGRKLEDAVASLCDSDGSVDTYFEKIQDNLREGQLRLVFFLDESPMELRSLVDFLNKQMERTEVLLVEARQYTKDGLRLVVPTLFGYTEEARMVKRTVTVSRTPGKIWDAVSFFDTATACVDPKVLAALRSIHDKCLRMGGMVTWGKGGQGTFMFRHPGVCKNALFAVRRDATLNLKFGDIHGSPSAEQVRAGKRLLDRGSLGVLGTDCGRVPRNGHNADSSHNVKTPASLLHNGLSVQCAVRPP
ncbi:MAG: hypothetical protein NT031_13315 [Planctomycetota bacterium]|nr:hypothetical protein [Planctomycetota bacterium]